FREEQPEDMIVKREAAPPAGADVPEAPAKEAAAPVTGSWREVCEKAAPALPRELRASIRDESRVRGVLEDGALVLEVVPGFLYQRFDRQDVHARLAEAARAVYGRELRIQMRELHQQAQQRSLDELKAFPEVRFV
ncbi:MAG: hypothetical protein IJ594_03470, partial [Oscillospiraceae bacterium]|nr:hypothetical protein [Oscillospiraceae bacterium]